MTETKRNYVPSWWASQIYEPHPPVATPRPVEPHRTDEACPAVRATTPLLLGLLLIPSLLAFVVRYVPETERFFYVDRGLEQLDPLTFHVISGRAPDDHLGDLTLLLALSCAAALHAAMRRRWGANRLLLTSLAAVVVACMGVMIVDRAGDSLDEHLCGVTLGLLAAGTALSIACAGLAIEDPPWARPAHLRRPRWLAVYVLGLLPALAVGRAIDSPDERTRGALDLVINGSAPAWVAQWLNGVWIGVAVWAAAQFLAAPRWVRWNSAALLLALAVGPLRDLALVTPVLPAGWDGWG